MDEIKSYSGWSIRNPWRIRTMPEALSDLIIEIRFIANFELPDFYATQEEAIQKLKGYLINQRDQALRDLDFLSRPYISPNGLLLIDDPHMLEQWRAECRESLEIALRGLELCDPTSRGG